MRTTIDLPEPLFKSLKLLTSQQGVSLKAFVTQALEAALKAQAPAPPRMGAPLIKRNNGMLRALSKQELANLLESEDEGKAGPP